MTTDKIERQDANPVSRLDTLRDTRPDLWEQTPAAFCELLEDFKTWLLRLQEERVKLDAIARFLFDRIDDIDTMADMAKGDREAYYRSVDRLQKRRFEVGETDGYSVWWKDVPTVDYKAERDALLEALKEIVEIGGDGVASQEARIAMQAVANVEGKDG